MIRFEIGSRVTIKSLNKKGEITQYKHEKFEVGNGAMKETKKYMVRITPYESKWIDEYDLAYDYDIEEFDDKFEIDFLNVLIDINLEKRNFDIVKQLYEQKQEYINRKR